MKEPHSGALWLLMPARETLLQLNTVTGIAKFTGWHFKCAMARTFELYGALCQERPFFAHESVLFSVKKGYL
jgi:hypothetical protein